ncbi:MAG: BON domain-containing protein [Proteobacteria bacterium]|nr:BON domain-containing protein [Pseudomonadota bacterium]
MRATAVSRLLALAVAALLLDGCASYSAWRTCGWRGCPGDAQLTSAVRAELQGHADLAANPLYVHTSGAVVFLSGQVATDLQRETAADLARAVPGVRRVQNDIALEYDGR